MTIRIAAKAVIIENDQILLTKNKDKIDGLDYYLLPGGGQEKNESLEQTIVRECLEEIGEEVYVGDAIHIREYIGNNHNQKERHAEFHQVECIFKAELKDKGTKNFSPIAPDDYQTDVEWIHLSELDRIRFYPKDIVPHLLNLETKKVYVGDID
jgi:8-oxo-dGTP diphosphatase